MKHTLHSQERHSCGKITETLRTNMSGRWYPSEHGLILLSVAHMGTKTGGWNKSLKYLHDMDMERIFDRNALTCVLSRQNIN
jgi:hypothetical protein